MGYRLWVMGSRFRVQGSRIKIDFILDLLPLTDDP
jgi:hypothetical protein